MKTFHKSGKDIKRSWHLIDAKDKVLGRMSTDIARLLIGKHKVDYSPHLDMGDYVVVINASGIILTGKKTSQKVYRSHSGYLGNLKEVKFAKMFEERPTRIVEYAVSGMLPDNRLKSKRLRRLKIFSDANHIYEDKFKETK